MSACAVAVLAVACGSESNSSPPDTTADDVAVTTEASPTSAPSTTEPPATSSTEPAVTTVPASSAGPTSVPATSEPPASTAPPPTTTPPTTTTTTVAPAAFDVPVGAITTGGDAVLLTGPDDPPVLLFDGPSPAELADVVEGPGPNGVDHVSISPDGAIAYVGTCCEPAAGAYLRTEPPALATFGEGQGFGYNPSPSPDGRLLVVGDIFSLVVVTDTSSGAAVPVENDSGIPADGSGPFSPWDAMWSSTERFEVLGVGADGWVVIPGSVGPDGAVRLEPAFTVASFADAGDGTVGFAGVGPDGDVLVHRSDASVATRFGRDGEPRGEVTLAGPSRSVWIEPGRPIVRVDTDGRLTVGDAAVSGDFLWARS